MSEQCPHEAIEATCLDCNCDCAGCAHVRAAQAEGEARELAVAAVCSLYDHDDLDELDTFDAAERIVAQVQPILAAARPVLSREALRAALLHEPYRLAHILCHAEHPDVANTMTGFAAANRFYVSCATHKAKAGQVADAALDVLADVLDGGRS